MHDWYDMVFLTFMQTHITHESDECLVQSRLVDLNEAKNEASEWNMIIVARLYKATQG